VLAEGSSRAELRMKISSEARRFQKIAKCSIRYPLGIGKGSYYTDSLAPPRELGIDFDYAKGAPAPVTVKPKTTKASMP
jgi:hypothetical protein